MAEAATVRSREPRAWRAVLEHVERGLLDGDLAPGDRLPGERRLAADLGVGRSSVREALRVLEAMGLVRTQTGSGPTAGAIIVSTPSGGMSTLMRLQVAASGFPVHDIVATRLLLEAHVVGDLASDAAPGAADAPAGSGPVHALGAAERLLDAMDDPGLEPAEFLALDASFHLALAEASGNQVVTAMMVGIRNGIEAYALAGQERIADWSATSSRLRAEHRGVLDAIRSRDPAAARTRIRDHISGYFAEISSVPGSAPSTRP
ncbi:FadR/GntR family transcriptional regulator [Agromyces sp. SYSU T0242]|uniref:FadR/GntR family transcriptional regulator n=1 Tax=Agromyces litoreus TaxID=3158561 RepID=UPI00339A7422